MRRLLSITTVAALVLSMASPLLAAACTGTGKAVSCHMEEMQDDQPMMHHHHGDVAESTPTSAALTADDDTKCPMDCCTPGHPQSGAAVAAAVALPLPAIAGLELQFFSITFSSPGFSSHTDRGPPVA